MVTLDAHKRFYRASRMFALHPTTPRYRKHQIEGYLLARAWEHVRENREFLRELREFSETQVPPALAESRFGESDVGPALGPGLETPTA
jgi:hypothetical protein